MLGCVFHVQDVFTNAVSTEKLATGDFHWPIHNVSTMKHCKSLRDRLVATGRKRERRSGSIAFLEHLGELK